MTITQPRHKPAHWIAGEAVHLITVTERHMLNDLAWHYSERLTEGELEIMVSNQLNAGMITEADVSGMMLTSVQVYDEWFSRSTRQ